MSVTKEWHRAYYAKNREKINQRKRKWRSRPEVREREQEQRRTYRLKNKDKERAYRARTREAIRLRARRIYVRNRERIIAQQRDYYAANRSIISQRRRLSKYGMTQAQFDAQLKIQKWRCPICKRNLKKLKTNVDHCHKAGHVRSILCFGCNTGLGLFLHSITSLQGAIEYLRSEVLFNGDGTVSLANNAIRTRR